MYVKEILRDKGYDVYTIPSTATLTEVVDELVARNCGSLVVVDSGQMVGIVTERDILRACSQRRISLQETMLRDVMMRNVLTVTPCQKVSEVMGLMTEYRVRHLPVTNQDSELMGILSIGDVVKAHHAELTRENEFLKEYISS